MNIFALAIWVIYFKVHSRFLDKERKTNEEWKEGFFESLFNSLIETLQFIPFIVYNFYVGKNTTLLVYAADFIFAALLICSTFYLFKKVKKENRYKYLIVSALVSSLLFICCYLFLPLK